MNDQEIERKIKEGIDEAMHHQKTSHDVEREIQKEPAHKSHVNLDKIGRLMVQRRKLGKKPQKHVDDITKKSFDDAVKYIESNETEMEESNEDQRRLYAYVKEGLIKVRSSNTYEELESNIKSLDNIKTLNQNVDVDGVGETTAKKYIDALINKIVTESKPSKIRQVGHELSKGLFSQEGTMIGAAMKEFGFVGKAIQKLIPALDRDKSEKTLGTFDEELYRLRRKESSANAKYKSTQFETKKPVAKSIDPGIVSKQSNQESVKSQEPIKIGNQKIYPDDPMYAKIMSGSKITEPQSEQVQTKIESKPTIESPQVQTKTESKPTIEAKPIQKDAKISTLVIDKIIAKSIVLDKPAQVKPHIKLKSDSRVENKPFKSELLGEEPKQEESGVSGEKGLLDSLKDMLLGGVVGQNLKKLPSIGSLAKTVVSRAALPVSAGLLAASPYMMSEHGMEANPNETDNYKLSKPISEMGAWEKFTNKVGAKRQSIEEMMESGKKFDDQQAADIKKYYEIDVPQQNLLVNTKPTMIEQAAQEIPKVTEKIETKAAEVGSTPVIIQQPSQAQPAQQTPQVIPMAGSVRPSESAWQRQQDRTVK